MFNWNLWIFTPLIRFILLHFQTEFFTLFRRRPMFTNKIMGPLTPFSAKPLCNRFSSFELSLKGLALSLVQVIRNLLTTLTIAHKKVKLNRDINLNVVSVLIKTSESWAERNIGQCVFIWCNLRSLDRQTNTKNELIYERKFDCFFTPSLRVGFAGCFLCVDSGCLGSLFRI